jgi:hypothetical protein
MLNAYARYAGTEAQFEVAEVKDPESFVTYLRQAHVITRFTVTFSRPNAIDASDDFLKPCQRALSGVGGEKGKVEFSGEHLAGGALEEVSRSAAATGDDASATMRMLKDGRKQTKHLKGNQVFLAEEDITTDEGKESFAERIKKMYERIRGR